MALEAIINRCDAYRVILEQCQEGVYVFIFDSVNSMNPEREYLQDSLEIAKEMALDEFGITEAMWNVRPDTQSKR